MMSAQQLEQLYARRPPSHIPLLNTERNAFVQSRYLDTKKCVYDLMKDAYHLKRKMKQEKEIIENEKWPFTSKKTQRPKSAVRGRPQWDSNLSK